MIITCGYTRSYMYVYITTYFGKEKLTIYNSSYVGISSVSLAINFGIIHKSLNSVHKFTCNFKAPPQVISYYMDCLNIEIF